MKKGISNMPGDSRVKANQIRTVDKRRLMEQIGTVPEAILKEIEKAVKIHLDLQ